MDYSKASQTWTLVDGRGTSADELGALLASVQEASGGHYPPAEVAEGPGELARWVAELDAVGAWAARSLQGELVGWVQVESWGPDPVRMPLWCAPSAVIPGGLSGPGDVMVVSRLVTHPAWARRGIGTALLLAALDEVRERGLVPVLGVLDGSGPVEALYVSHGGERLGEFVGLGDHCCVAYRFAPTSARDADHGHVV